MLQKIVIAPLGCVISRSFSLPLSTRQKECLHVCVLLCVCTCACVCMRTRKKERVKERQFERSIGFEMKDFSTTGKSCVCSHAPVIRLKTLLRPVAFTLTWDGPGGCLLGKEHVSPLILSFTSTSLLSSRSSFLIPKLPQHLCSVCLNKLECF